MPLATIFQSHSCFQATALNGGMGKAAWQANAPFREALREVNTLFARVQSWSIVDELSARPAAKNSPRDLFSAFAIGAAGSNRKSS